MRIGKRRKCKRHSPPRTEYLEGHDDRSALVRPRSLTGLLYRSIVLSGCLRCLGTHPSLWVNTRPSTCVFVSTMLVESAYFSETLTCLPQNLPLPHLRCRSAPLVYRGRHYGNPHKGTLVVRRGGSKNGCGEPSIFLHPHDGITDVGRYTLLQSVPALCSTCTCSIVVGRLELLARQSDLIRPLTMKFEEW